jgi:Carboxypeptidase regulatory-like domain
LNRLSLLLLMLILARPAHGQAQPNLVVNGVVQDQTGAAFFGAQVDLLKGGVQQATTTTDASGSFRFERVQPGNYEVRIHQEGFKTETVKVAIGSRSPARLRIVLSIETLNQQITVSGDAAEVSIDSSENRDVATVDDDQQRNSARCVRPGCVVPRSVEERDTD